MSWYKSPVKARFSVRAAKCSRMTSPTVIASTREATRPPLRDMAAMRGVGSGRSRNYGITVPLTISGRNVITIDDESRALTRIRSKRVGGNRRANGVEPASTKSRLGEELELLQGALRSSL